MSLINREALLAEYDRFHVGEPGKARKLIEDAPTVEPERKKGNWINVRHDNIAECSSCGGRGRAWMNFCFDCGADMRGDSDDQSK